MYMYDESHTRTHVDKLCSTAVVVPHEVLLYRWHHTTNGLAEAAYWYTTRMSLRVLVHTHENRANISTHKRIVSFVAIHTIPPDKSPGPVALANYRSASGSFC